MKVCTSTRSTVHTFKHKSIEDQARKVFAAGVQSVQADRLLKSQMAGAARSLAGYRRVQVVGLGKASMAMAGALEERLRAEGAEMEGMAVVPSGYPGALPDRLPAPERIEVLEGGHPVPDEKSLRAGRRALQVAEDAAEGDLLLALISGGGTALCTGFAEGIALKEAQAVYELLLGSGADIHAMNAVRKHLSTIGGGQLARIAQPADLLGWAVSDVPGDDLATIASGPTVPDPTTFADAVEVLSERGLWEEVPESVRVHLQRGLDGELPDTPGEGDPAFAGADTRLIGNSRTAVEAAAAEARAQGYAVEVTGDVTGEARAVGRRWARRALRMAEERPDQEPPLCLLGGGETTVTIRGSGTGGRNQELALSAALELEGHDAPVAFLSAGTDGIDGPTDAAGACVTPATARRMRARGLDPQARLDDNDSHPALQAAGALVRTGPTHTNVMDLLVALVR